MLHTKDMRRTTITCHSCHSKPATVPMFPITGNTLKAVPMCEDCAWTAFESGTHESDLNEDPAGNAHE